MANINQPSSGPTGILNKCKEINDGVAELSAKRQNQLGAAQNALLDSSTGKEDQAARQTLDYVEDEMNTALRYLRDQFKRIKETPGSGDPRVQGQVENVSRNLRKEIEQYQRSQSDFQKRLREQVRRRYEIANPDATPEELQQGVENVLMGQEQSFAVSYVSSSMA
jgi:syntaxin 1B/2/3